MSRHKRKTFTASAPFAISDSVRVKAGVLDPEDEYTPLAGWQGRVVEVDMAGKLPLVGIQWDSLTLLAMPLEMICRNEIRGYEWQAMSLGFDDVEKVEPRDAESAVALAERTVKDRHRRMHTELMWRLEQTVLAGVNPGLGRAAAEAWRRYLQAHLTFPFEVRLESYTPDLRPTETLKARKLAAIDEWDELVMEVRGKKDYELDLFEIIVKDETSANFALVRDYMLWLAGERHGDDS